MLRWPVFADLHRRSFWKSSITEPHNLTCQGISCDMQPQCEKLKATNIICLLAFIPGHFVFSVTSGYLKFLVRKHIGSWHQQANAKDSSCVFQLLLHFSVHPPICFVQGLFSAMVYFGFALFIFFEGHVHHCHPSSSSGVSQTVLYLYLWIAILVNCNDLSVGKKCF